MHAYLTERDCSRDSLLLDANEHYHQWVIVSPAILRTLHRYPDRQATDLRQALAHQYCRPFSSDNLLITSGSIEAIDLLMYSLKPQAMAINTPSYDIYQQRALIHGVKVNELALLDNGQPNIEAVQRLTSENELLVLINPNNPTGELVHKNTVRQILNSFKGTIVIDEAYIEYAGLRNSMQEFVLSHPNVVILRTFSKAWGLAGLRLGYIIATKEMITQLALYQNTYSVNSVALASGLCALQQLDELQNQVDKTLLMKAALLQRFKQVGVTVRDSDANFIIIEEPQQRTIHEIYYELKEQGILARPRPLVGSLKECLRVTIGSEADNDHFFTAFMRALHD